jgi:hypothetical protein
MTDESQPLSSELQQLLENAKPLVPAPHTSKTRVLQRLNAELIGAAGGAETSTAAPHAGEGLMAKAVVLKWVGAASATSLFLGGLLGAGLHAAVTPSLSVSPPPPVSVAVVPRDTPLTSSDASVESDEAALPTSKEPFAPRVSPDEIQPRSTQERGQGPSSALALEKSFLEQARAAMARQDPEAALQALELHERRFPRGQLTEERMALKVMSLSSAGRSIEARNAAAAFRDRFPRGLLREAVDAIVPP